MLTLRPYSSSYAFIGDVGPWLKSNPQQPSLDCCLKYSHKSANILFAMHVYLFVAILRVRADLQNQSPLNVPRRSIPFHSSAYAYM